MPPAAVPSFAQRAAEWQTFYAALAGATATLAGLLFVALSLNVEILLRGEQAHFKALASHTLRTYVTVFILAMILLIPHELAITVGCSLIITGLMGAVEFLVSLRTAFPRGTPWGASRTRLVVSLVCNAGLVDLGAWLLFRPETSLNWLAPLVLALLVMAIRNSWHLLIGLRESPRPPSPPLAPLP